ncbi:hypothetical protein ACFL6I_07830 [candidate division KSB1 bacterium]
MNTKSKTLLIVIVYVLAVIILLVSGSRAQSIGNPFSLNKNTWSIGIGTDFARYELDGHRFVSTRSIAKVDFALSDYLDAAVFLGVSNMRIYFPVERLLESFKSNMQFSQGAALKLQLPGCCGTRNIFAEIGGYRFNLVGTTRSRSLLNPGEYYMKYDWQEYWGTVGGIYRKGLVDLYAGYQGRVIHQRELFEQTQYKSGMKSSFIIGCDIGLPNNYSTNLHLRTNNGITISFGISQTAFWKN